MGTCEKCRKDACVMYLNLDFGMICPECEDVERSKETRSKWEKICERMEKKYGRCKDGS